MSKYLFDHLLAEIDLPERAYELAEKRYTDLGEYLTREESAIARFDPHVAPQGSFRLGTAIRPLNKEEYDVDLNCVLRKGITEKSNTQKELKKLVGRELKKYRAERNINAPVEQKRRCWRLLYADEMSFHLDIVPGIPAPENQKQHIQTNLIKHSPPTSNLQQDLAQFTLYITDEQDPSFEIITDPWHISNPEGYAKWFESRMMLAQIELFKADVADMPRYTLKTPLQQLVQLLKRHRDVMYAHPNANTDLKPISIIITTLAARAYEGETSLIDAVRAIPPRMMREINSTEPRVPNPVNPEEDFADKWKSEPELETHFYQWLVQVQRDLEGLADLSQQADWDDIVKYGFKLTPDDNTLKNSSQDSLRGAAAAGATTIISPDSPKPWGN